MNYVVVLTLRTVSNSALRNCMCEEGISTGDAPAYYRELFSYWWRPCSHTRRVTRKMVNFLRMFHALFHRQLGETVYTFLVNNRVFQTFAVYSSGKAAELRDQIANTIVNAVRVRVRSATCISVSFGCLQDWRDKQTGSRSDGTRGDTSAYEAGRLLPQRFCILSDCLDIPSKHNQGTVSNSSFCVSAKNRTPLEGIIW
ncbi:hypothetical protein CSUI_005601, partial [Cystoisospora suis]